LRAENWRTRVWKAARKFFRHHPQNRTGKGFACDEESARGKIGTSICRAARAPNEKFSARARKNSLTIMRNFITQHANAPSDGIYQPLSKISCDPHLRIERGDYRWRTKKTAKKKAAPKKLAAKKPAAKKAPAKKAPAKKAAKKK